MLLQERFYALPTNVSYSKYLTIDWKEANRMFFYVKGHLIPDEYTLEDVQRMYDSYFKRLWGNNERAEYCCDEFEALWEKRTQ
jgi:hypothetical protein